MKDPYAIRFLNRAPFDEVHGAMAEAFADYALDMSYMTREVLRCRAVKNGVDFAASPGAFLDGRLVGLTLVGVGIWAGEPAAFDACTGIVKAHRGQGLAGRLFEAALPGLRRRGVSRFLLEVLQENAPAIKAYERTGFRITRPLACYQCGDLELARAPETCAIRLVERDILDTFAAELDWQPSWENSFRAIRAIPDEVRLYGAFDGSLCTGLVVYYPTLRWIMTLLVKRSHRNRGIGKALLDHALGRLDRNGRPVRANNVDPADAATATVLQRCGFKTFTSQFEMVYEIR